MYLAHDLRRLSAYGVNRHLYSVMAVSAEESKMVESLFPEKLWPVGIVEKLAEMGYKADFAMSHEVIGMYCRPLLRESSSIVTEYVQSRYLTRCGTARARCVVNCRHERKDSTVAGAMLLTEMGTESCLSFLSPQYLRSRRGAILQANCTCMYVHT